MLRGLKSCFLFDSLNPARVRLPTHLWVSLHVWRTGPDTRVRRRVVSGRQQTAQLLEAFSGNHDLWSIDSYGSSVHWRLSNAKNHFYA